MTDEQTPDQPAVEVKPKHRMPARHSRKVVTDAIEVNRHGCWTELEMLEMDHNFCVQMLASPDWAEHCESYIARALAR
jgi:hypothetical protein